MAEQVFNWILALVALLVSPAAPGAAPLQFDVLGKDGFRYTVGVVQRDAGQVTFARLEGEERRPIGSFRPADPAHPTVALAFSGAGGPGTILMAPFDAVAARLARLTPERPVEFDVGDRRIVVLRRGDVVYASDRAAGDTYVIRLPAPPAPGGEAAR